MTRRTIYVIASVAFTLAVALCFNSQDEERHVLIVDDYRGIELAAISLPSYNDLAIETEILAPKFENNFNRLWSFPELGSRGILKGHRLTIRGPPKS